MKLRRWRIVEEGAATVIARPSTPLRWDISVSRAWPAEATGRAFRLSLAHQIRQDIWRALRGTRGFAPLVRVYAANGMIEAQAGGVLMTGAGRPEALAERIAEVLDAPAYRRRWLAHAGRMAR